MGGVETMVGMEAWVYWVRCNSCGYSEERRVEGGGAPQFGLVELREVRDERGVPRMTAACPLCGAMLTAGRRAT